MRNRFFLTPFALDQRVELMDRLAGADWIVNMATPEPGDTMARIAAVHRPLATLVENAVASGHRPISIGGDCCQTLAVRAGLQRAGVDPVLVWLDAHGDFNTRETSPSGFIGGMPLAMHVGRGDMTLMQQLALQPMAEADVVLSDARDLDPGERVSLERSAVTHVTRVEDVLARLPEGRPIYVHLDVDVIDARETPAMSYPVNGGPSLAAMMTTAARIRETGNLVAVSMTTWALDRDEDRRTERACLAVLDALASA